MFFTCLIGSARKNVPATARIIPLVNSTANTALLKKARIQPCEGARHDNLMAKH